MTPTSEELEKYSLSQWAELALDDITKTERSPLYQVDMSLWHKPNSYCAVCFAGSVMAKTLGADITKKIDPSHYDTIIESALLALNHLRSGHVLKAIMVFDGTSRLRDLDAAEYAVDVAEYADDKTIWRKDMRKIIKILKVVGL